MATIYQVQLRKWWKLKPIVQSHSTSVEILPDYNWDNYILFALYYIIIINTFLQSINTMNRNTIMTIIICSVVIQQQLHAKIR